VRAKAEISTKEDMAGKVWFSGSWNLLKSAMLTPAALTRKRKGTTFGCTVKDHRFMLNVHNKM
jgi:hypothetical protein